MYKVFMSIRCDVRFPNDSFIIRLFLYKLLFTFQVINLLNEHKTCKIPVLTDLVSILLFHGNKIHLFTSLISDIAIIFFNHVLSFNSIT